MATDKQIKAEQANQILGNPVFVEGYDKMIDGIVETIAAMPLDDKEGRLGQTYLLSAAAMFKESLMDHIDTAKLEAAEAAKRARDEEGQGSAQATH